MMDVDVMEARDVENRLKKTGVMERLENNDNHLPSGASLPPPGRAYLEVDGLG